MQSKIVAIGNSKGVRLPQDVLRRCSLDAGDPVDIEVRARSIVISPGREKNPRPGWEEKLRAASAGEVREDLLKGVPVGEACDQ
jgi:antitoxin component of MazEF toxin-antitoxin module